MATTTPFPFATFLTEPDENITRFIEWYESALADSDKAGEVDTAAYHEGRAEAFADVLCELLPVTQEHWDAYRKGWAVTPATADAMDPQDAPHPRIVIGDDEED